MKRSLKSVLWPGLVFLFIVLQACSANNGSSSDSARESTPESVAELLSAAQNQSGADAASLILEAMEEMLAAEQPQRVALEIERIERPAALPADLRIRYAIIQARLALDQQQPQLAIDVLTGDLVQNLDTQTVELRRDYYLALGNSLRANDQAREAVTNYLVIDNLAPEFQTESLHDEIWYALNELDDSQLQEFASEADSYALRGWIELARVIRQDQFSIKGQLDSVNQWKRIWTQHPANKILPAALADLQQIWQQRPTRLALLLPLQTPAGSAIQEGFLSAYYQALEVSREVPQISVFDTSNIRSISAIYDEAVASGANLIIGPLDKTYVNQLQQMRELPVPTLALNYADNSNAGPANLFQFGLSPEDEMEQAAKLARSLGYRNAAVITPQTDDYLRLQGIFANIWRAHGGNLVSNASFSGDSDYGQVVKRLMAIDASEARAERLLSILPRNNMEFTPRRRGDIDFIFLIANPRQGRQLKPTLAFYFAEDVPVFSMPAIYDGLQNQSANRDLDGIIFTDAPLVLSSNDPLKDVMIENLRQVQGPLQRLRAMGVDSFRLYPMLQQLASGQIERVHGTTGTLSMSNQQRIHRELEVAKFIDGFAQSISLDAIASE